MLWLYWVLWFETKKNESSTTLLLTIMDDNEICFLIWWHRMSVFYAGWSMGGPTGMSKANVTLVHRRAIWREISKFRLQPTNVAHMPNDLGLARSARLKVDS